MQQLSLYPLVITVKLSLFGSLLPLGSFVSICLYLFPFVFFPNVMYLYLVPKLRRKLATLKKQTEKPPNN